jgi:long-chain-fatty-acid--CoA ligase ACSBG
LHISLQGSVAADTPWTKWTWNEYRANVDAFGKALVATGCQKFDTINIIGFNAPEWFFANFGAIAAGCVAAGIYSTNAPEACKYISEHSKAKVVVCEGVKQLEKYYTISKDLPNLKALVLYGPDAIPSDVATKCSVPVYTFESFLALGQDTPSADLKERSDSWKPGETCTLIYTSGTTGPPKAVMITNDNITWTVDTLLLASRKGYMNETDVMISYLPLSHIAAQMIDMHIPIQTGMQIYFAQPDALKGSLGKTLLDVRPTTFFGVPRVWEKIYGTFLLVALVEKD